MGWWYSSAVEPVGGAPWYPGVVTTLENIHEQYVSMLTGEPGGAEYGSRTVRVGSITPTTGGGGDPLADIATSYRLSVAITDAASGQTGWVRYTGRAGEDASWVGDPPYQQPTDRRAYVAGLTPTTAETLHLGGHDYRVAVTGRSGADGSAYLDAAVSVGAVSESPEPGTLAVAAVALAGVAGARWRKRRWAGGR